MTNQQGGEEFSSRRDMQLFGDGLQWRMKRLFRQARSRAGMSVEAAAAALDVSPDTIKTWEKASGEPPGWGRYIAAALIFDAPDMIEALLAEHGWRVRRPAEQPEVKLAEVERLVGALHGVVGGRTA